MGSGSLPKNSPRRATLSLASPAALATLFLFLVVFLTAISGRGMETTDTNGFSEELFVNSMIDKITEDQKKEETEGESLIIAIDPGFHNFGMVIGYFRRVPKKGVMEIHWEKIISACLNICEPGAEIPEMYTKLRNNLINRGINHLPGIENALIIVEAAPYIPKNMKLVKQLTQMTALIYSTLHELCPGAIIQMVQPAAMKRSLKIATKNYGENKKAAEEFCYRVLAIAPNTDHEADCWCYIYHCFWQIYENKRGRHQPKRIVKFTFNPEVMVEQQQ